MNWITQSPNVILLLIGIIAFAESFALVGIIVPGVVLLFSLSALANSAGLSPVITVIPAAIGALLGDLTSFYLGIKSKSHLMNASWLQRHQSWIEQGTWFFHRWGWLSVIIGRFLGPLRPIIPFVAGTLDMPIKTFVSLASVTVIVWAPVYILPGYYTGEFSEIWQLQSPSTQSLIEVTLTAIAISGLMLATYHHTHPDRLLLWGWITRRQAERWPIASISLIVISSLFFVTLMRFSPLKADTLFLASAIDWQQQPAALFWKAFESLTNYLLVSLEWVLITVWLFLTRRFAAASIGACLYGSLGVFSYYFAQQFVQPTQPTVFLAITSFVFTVGMLAKIVNSRYSRLRRWPRYLFAILMMLLGVVAHIWHGTLSASSGGIALFLALIFNGFFGIAWHTNYANQKASPIRGLMALFVVINGAMLTLRLMTH